MSTENNTALKAMVKEALELLEGRHSVVSQADRNIATTLVRLAEAIAYGLPKTPRRSYHHGEDDPTGLPASAQEKEAKAQALAKLTPDEKRVLGLT